MPKSNETRNLQRKWIHALESGKYEQGQGCLNKDNKFCCLGVACSVSRKGKWIDGYNVTHYRIPNIPDITHSLNDKLNNLFGLSDDGFRGKLIGANDENNPDLHFSFEEIASVLRMEFDIWD